MYAQFKGSGKRQKAYIAKSFRCEKGAKTSTTIVESLGYLSDIAAAHPGVDPMEWVRQRAAELTLLEKEGHATVRIELDPEQSVNSKHQRKVKGGMLPLLAPYYQWLGLGRICAEIQEKRCFKYSLSELLAMLCFGRILSPDSKLATLAKGRDFVTEAPFSIDNVYGALSVIAEESDFIQKGIWANTSKLGRDTSIIYYDCTNYYFEIEKDDQDRVAPDGTPKLGLRKHGHSKQNSPNPIVQLGMFMDADGMPLAFCVNPGNTPETQTIIPLEEKLANDFGLSSFVCCTDGGLGSREVRDYNMTEGREYITVQSLKGTKIEAKIRDWALEDGHWLIPGDEDSEAEYTLAEAKKKLGKAAFQEAVLYKHRWFVLEDAKGEEHYVVTYSQKYADYVKATRDEQVKRAQKKIDKHQSTTKKGPNDCRRFIRDIHYTDAGEAADKVAHEIDYEQVAEEAKFDGFYALATSLDDAPLAILKANSYRQEIEALFRVTKTDLELRPIYLQRADRIIGHFIMCFISLLMVKKLQKDLGGKYSVEKVIEALREWDYLLLEAHGYVPSFNRTDVTDALQSLTKQRLDAQIIKKAKMRSIIKELCKI